MPFVSEAQKGWMYANKPEMAKEWQKHTPKGKKLPEKVSKEAAVSNEADQALSWLYQSAGVHPHVFLKAEGDDTKHTERLMTAYLQARELMKKDPSVKPQISDDLKKIVHNLNIKYVPDTDTPPILMSNNKYFDYSKSASKKAFWTGFCEKCAKQGVSPFALLQKAKQ